MSWNMSCWVPELAELSVLRLCCADGAVPEPRGVNVVTIRSPSGITIPGVPGIVRGPDTGEREERNDPEETGDRAAEAGERFKVRESQIRGSSRENE